MVYEKTDDMLPVMYPMCVNVKNEMLKSPKIQNALMKSNLDDIVTSWTGMFLHSVYHIFKDLRHKENIKWDNSLLFCGLSSQAAQLDWMIYCACYGQYDLVMRDLRNVLECAFLYYREDYDKSLQNKTLEEKMKELKRLKHNEIYGKNVFKKSGYINWGYAYHKLYKKMCGYTHTTMSLENAQKLFEEFNGISEPEYDEKKMLECIHMIQEVLVVECNLMESVLQDVYEVEDVEYAGFVKKNV